MPTYVVTHHTNRLQPAQKTNIVRAITQIHSQEGRAPQYLVQVIFNPIPAGDWFINARPVPADQIWIRGDIRPGRTEEQKNRLCERMTAECAAAVGIEGSYVWVYIVDADKTSEFGKVLPKPGEEAKWLEEIDGSVRERYGF